MQNGTDKQTKKSAKFRTHLLQYKFIWLFSCYATDSYINRYGPVFDSESVLWYVALTKLVGS